MNEKESPGRGLDDGAAPPPVAAVSLRRRRLLKIGAGAAPTALLLVGRPVHAQHACISTSAWGSQMVNPAASVHDRTLASARTVDAWSVTEWRTNTTHAPLNKPWLALRVDTDEKMKNMTIADAGVVAPRGTASHAKILDVLNGNSLFAKTMLVALLNEKLLGDGSEGVNRCVTPGTLSTMARGGLTDRAATANFSGWSDQQIIDYLQRNGLAAL